MPSQVTTTEGTSLPAPVAMIGPEFIATLGDFAGKCQKNNPTYTGSGYQKPRAFSGKQPVPAGEESFEAWLEQAMQSLEEGLPQKLFGT